MSTVECIRKVPDVRRRLILIRHAKSDYPDGVADHERPLNGRGRREAPAVGDWLAKHVAVVKPPLVIVSTATRTQQTWTLIQDRLTGPWSLATRIDERRIYEADWPSLTDVVREVPESHADVVLVGHSPGLPDLVAACAEPSRLVTQAMEHFPTSAVAVLATHRPWRSACDAPMVLQDFAVIRGKQ
jgi:phosphohistidine phosphatase